MLSDLTANFGAMAVYRRHLADACENCGFVPEDPCQLEVHHVDRNRSNNNPANLRTLCANCHRLVHKRGREDGRSRPAGPAAAPSLRVRSSPLFTILGEPSRIRILDTLQRTEEASVSELVGVVGLAQATVSHHLKVLRDAGLVESSRSGTWAFYRLVPDAVRELRHTLGG